MKCKNCGAEIFDGDKFCGECGHNVSATTQHEEPKSQTDTYAQEEPPGTTQKTTSIDIVAIFHEGWAIVKSSFLEPAKTIGSKHYSPASSTSGVMVALLIIFSLLSFITARSTTSEITNFYGEPVIPISMFFYTLLYAALIFALFFLITFLMNKVLLMNPAPFEKVLNDYVTTSTIVISFFILGVLLNLIALYEIGGFFFLIGAALFSFSPLYIFLRYSEINNTKFDSFYSITIYILLSGVAYYIIGRMMIAQAADSFFSEFINML